MTAAQSNTESLTEGLVGVCDRRISDVDLDQAGRLLLDWIGIALAGNTEATAAAPRNWVRSQNATGPCIALGVGRALPEQAAFVNGSLGTLLEMDDLHRRSILHAGDVVIPAALAAAQHSGSSGKGLLEAIIVGYEVALRIGVAAAAGGYSAWYNSGTCGVFGAAMAAARATGLSSSSTVDALGQAGMQASGLWQCRLEPTDSKGLATAHAARAGVTSAVLAGLGYRGARQILEGPLGFFPTYYPSADASAVLDRASVRWLIHDVSFKPWPACRHVHSAVGLALWLCDKVQPDAIRRIIVHSYAAGVEFCDNPEPKTSHEARFSFQHCLAVTLARGAPRLEDFQEEALNNTEIAALRSKIHVLEDTTLTADFPGRMGARLDIDILGAAPLSIAADHAPGDPEMPMDDVSLLSKFRGNLAWAGAGSNRAEAVIAAAADLRHAGTLDEFSASLEAISKETIEIRRKGDP